ncbi:MAG: HAMP domain-containing histidine kinase [Oscillospiraceae bacterium]|jgi:nitrogen-specific signal transduction histidine kinase|nr:HAMP domain-containing histidine kinase [Oscillospiraceae bacterium]
MFVKLRMRMMLFNLLAVSLVMLAAFSVIYLVTYKNIERDNQRRLEALTSMIFLPNREFPQRSRSISIRVPDSAGRAAADSGAFFVLFVSGDSPVNVNSQLDWDDSVYEDALRLSGERERGKITLADRKWIYMTAPELRTVQQSAHAPNPVSMSFKRIVFLDITNEDGMLKNLLGTLLAVGCGVLVILTWVSFRHADKAVRPIEDSYNKQRQFVSDASHELKTPLAVIGANVDAIAASGDETVRSQAEWLEYIRVELKRIGRLADDLLYLAKSENVENGENSAFDLSAVCETASASMEAVLYDSGKFLETDIAPGVSVTANPDKIAQVLYILLDNAGKYTPNNGRISLTLNRVGEYAVIRVENTGSGIAKSDLPRIFDRFYRTDASRSSETGGSGLGLSIAKSIVESIGGEISAESSDGVTAFTVRVKVSS